MDLETFRLVLHMFTHGRRFAPFFVELASGEQLDVSHPEALTIQQTLVVFRDPQGAYSVLAPEGVVRFCQVVPRS